MEAVSKDAFLGTSTEISCKITGLASKATVIWTLDTVTQSGSVEGELIADTQISILTVSQPSSDKVYTCVVTSGMYNTSAASKTSVSLNTYCKLMLYIYWHKNINPHYNAI